MKNIKNFISKQIKESLNNDKIEYIISEYASDDEVIAPCEALSEVEEFIYDGWPEKDAQEIMKGVEKIEPNMNSSFGKMAKKNLYLLLV